MKMLGIDPNISSSQWSSMHVMTFFCTTFNEQSIFRKMTDLPFEHPLLVD